MEEIPQGTGLNYTIGSFPSECMWHKNIGTGLKHFNGNRYICETSSCISNHNGTCYEING